METITKLQEAHIMPLVLASVGQMGMSPRSLGSVEPDAKVCDLVTKVGALETCLARFMETNRSQMVTVEENYYKLHKVCRYIDLRQR